MIRGCRVHGETVGPVAGPQRGQATVEAAVLIPFVVFVLLTVVQLGLVVHDRVMVTHGAREGARVAAVGADDDEIHRTVAVAGGLLVHRLDVDVVRSSGVATVAVNYDAPTTVPLVGGLLSDVMLSAVATMRLE